MLEAMQIEAVKRRLAVEGCENTVQSVALQHEAVKSRPEAVPV
jgi:hypothetical protein